MSPDSTTALVSIVTPVYNGEEHLRECLESVLAQTHRDWECIVVNNCSTDRSLEIAQEYAAKDARIRIVNQEQFHRANANFNVGMRQISSRSKYCKVLFADDWLFPECLEKMAALAEQNPSVGIVGAYRLLGKEVTLDGLHHGVSVLPGREVCRATLRGDYYLFGTATSLLLRADLVRGRDPFYNESNLHADTEVCYELLKKCDFGFVHQVLTFTRNQPGTLTSFSRSRRTFLAGFLGDLVRFGPVYMEPGEYKNAVDAHLRIYYRYLGKNVFQRRGKEFWQFHKQKMKELGLPLRRGRVFCGAVVEAADVALALNWWPYALLKRLKRAVAGGPKESPSPEDRV